VSYNPPVRRLVRRKGRTFRVADQLAEARVEVARANRILANEGVLDAFGHVSLRHPADPSRYLLSRSRAPELVEPDDVLEYDLDSEPVRPTNARLYAERVIHGEIYRARPDVRAIVHHHAPAMMPFCITGTELVAVFHLGAAVGPKVPFWDQREAFGDSNLLVVKPEEGRSLARALGQSPIVLMNRHGATVVAGGIPELVFRAVYSCRNAEFQYQAMMLGTIAPLSPGEVERADNINALATVVSRTWEYWSMRLEKSGNAFATAARKPASGARKARTKATAKKR
jgi:HCOMODA/2-hydroxy-3-carboxy-muconic semialdehyde decarboxylase